MSSSASTSQVGSKVLLGEQKPVQDGDCTAKGFLELHPWLLLSHQSLFYSNASQFSRNHPFGNEANRCAEVVIFYKPTLQFEHVGITIIHARKAQCWPAHHLASEPWHSFPSPLQIPRWPSQSQKQNITPSWALSEVILHGGRCLQSWCWVLCLTPSLSRGGEVERFVPPTRKPS